MPDNLPVSDFPVAIVQDRYGGCYSGGAWLAIANADTPFEGSTRIDWVFDTGPHGDDVTAGCFWNEAPEWIAAGDSPDHAIERLRAKNVDSAS